MARKTLKMLLVALIATFALSSMAEATTAPKKTRHRVKHSSRVASGAVTSGRAPVARKKAPVARSRTHARANATAQKPGAKKAPAKRRPSTKPR